MNWEQRVRRIAGCRICGNRSLEPVIDLGSQALASLFDDGRRENQLDAPIPLAVVRCPTAPPANGCGFVQLTHTVPPDILYHDYGYRSGINTTMRNHLRDLAREVESRIPLREGDLVVDIGANDGTTLLGYTRERLTRVGFEPSTIRPECSDHDLLYIPEVFSAAAFNARFPKERARVITSIAMFYDLDDPARFCRELHETLADDGLWVLEMSYLGAMLEHNSFDAICHEHLGYYNLHTLRRLLDETGFVLHDLAFNSANGGSLRCAIKKASVGTSVPAVQQDRIDAALRDEAAKGYHASSRYDQFRRDVERVTRGVRELLDMVRRRGERVYGYGASTKGNVLLQSCRIGPEDLTAIADRNPAKHWRRTLGTRIPICSEEEMRRARPDYLLILPWHFLDEFLERERELRASGTQFIVPFPQVRVA